MKYKAIIFDFDDTLVESRVQKWNQHKTVAKKFYNIDLADEEIAKHYGKPFSTLIGILYQNSDTLDNMNAAIYSVKDNFQKMVYPDAPHVVTNILNNGMEVAIISSAPTHGIIEDLTRMHFPVDRFICIHGEDKTSVHKPDPEVFSPLLEKLSPKGIQKKDILYVGDSMVDFHAARNADIDFIAVTTGIFTKEDFEKEGAKIVVSEIKELLDFI